MVTQEAGESVVVSNRPTVGGSDACRQGPSLTSMQSCLLLCG